jgi:hypothetical protein
MNIDYFNEYLYYKNKGIKPKAKEYILKFINSFENYEEKESWTLENLSKLKQDSNGRLRNELFEEIIFPVLFNGYKNKNVSLMIWLVKLWQNYYQNKRIWEKINYKTCLEIIKECYEIEPNNNDVIDIYLELEISWIAYSKHEWPSGILFGNDGATKEECNIILEEIPLLYKLDRNKKHFEYIKDYENKVREYMDRIRNNKVRRHCT